MADGEVLIVVGAAIIRDGAVLAAQRAEPESMRGGWEFPGGKVDPGESEEEALIRECREELDVDVRPLERLPREVDFPTRPGSPRAVLRLWTAELLRGEPRLVEHLALRWLTPETLDDVDWLPTDAPFLDDVRNVLAPHSVSSSLLDK
ncbi:mutT-like protein [Thermobifida fusca TM51]|jgi:8-oxo-dGTP diphosphatase|uniref:8-oxo-dGTP diphosphatase n=1 Tax=Thermobifida fusca TM51 TaxID=1169414 RepID=A0A9P2T8W4_THEFU|nr:MULTISPECIES: (deoxy)nucleoside triphosphate pyrophosphohydrolase [Thermobifida]EOR70483.1 mutT-like protein [Thermobifida fusca TM51]MBO2530448.1 (deoxy)nucleoside triphosphate pyrophosphohydrolase [Thermobifida sp.]MDD6790644.1 (deoxy)nucleoside triphosphate pyrophosphohydrolase [Thermobifida fusca]PPS93874.1 DNA mismatch repair protein MutT [Thermobifida fusca]PZN61213.1 MAG: (deoxy)nucleoside triphosphate pyrophosphohydrolase [Thermobifida fusca]